MQKKPLAKKHMLSVEAQQGLKLWNGKPIPVTRRGLARKCFVRKAGKRIGLIAREEYWTRIQWVYYPKEEHFENFDRNLSKIREEGPSKPFKGSVGSISVEKNLNEWEINWIQGHFRTSKNGSVNRALATKYGGWRQRILSQMFKEARRKKKRIILKIAEKNANNGEKARSIVQQEILKQVAQKEGFAVTKEGNCLVASFG